MALEQRNKEIETKNRQKFKNGTLSGQKNKKGDIDGRKHRKWNLKVLDPRHPL